MQRCKREKQYKAATRNMLKERTKDMSCGRYKTRNMFPYRYSFKIQNARTFTPSWNALNYEIIYCALNCFLRQFHLNKTYTNWTDMKRQKGSHYNIAVQGNFRGVNYN